MITASRQYKVRDTVHQVRKFQQKLSVSYFFKVQKCCKNTMNAVVTSQTVESPDTVAEGESGAGSVGVMGLFFARLDLMGVPCRGDYCSLTPGANFASVPDRPPPWKDCRRSRPLSPQLARCNTAVETGEPIERFYLSAKNVFRPTHRWVSSIMHCLMTSQSREKLPRGEFFVSSSSPRECLIHVISAPGFRLERKERERRNGAKRQKKISCTGSKRKLQE